MLFFLNMKTFNFTRALRGKRISRSIFKWLHNLGRTQGIQPCLGLGGSSW
jgi:hypothetical protein